jgi:hypothetical protein
MLPTPLSFVARSGTSTSATTTLSVLFGVSGTSTATSTDDNNNDNGNNNGNNNNNNDDNNAGGRAHHSGDFNRPVETINGVINAFPPTVGVGQVLGASTQFLFNNNLTVGSRGIDVTMLQAKLAEWGYFRISPTGYFGSMTKASVKAFQKANNLPQTGFFGPMTRAVINAMLQS